MRTIVVRIPALPDCWDTCGNCSDGELQVVEILVSAGQSVRRFDPVVVVEADKTTLEVPVQMGGRVMEVLVQRGDRVNEGSPLLMLDVGASG